RRAGRRAASFDNVIHAAIMEGKYSLDKAVSWWYKPLTTLSRPSYLAVRRRRSMAHRLPSSRRLFLIAAIVGTALLVASLGARSSAASPSKARAAKSQV